MAVGLVVDARVRMDLGADPAAVGAAVTVALCGSWTHPPPCPLAPHRTDVVPVDDPSDDGRCVGIRVVAVAPDDRQIDVRRAVEAALRGGRLDDAGAPPAGWALLDLRWRAPAGDEADLVGYLAEVSPSADPPDPRP